jgi:hypothetical protein
MTDAEKKHIFDNAIIKINNCHLKDVSESTYKPYLIKWCEKKLIEHLVVDLGAFKIKFENIGGKIPHLYNESFDWYADIILEG